MTNRTYDVLKFIAQVVLPSLGTLYAALGLIWRLPYTDEIPKTLLAIDAFLGALLGISSARYNASIDHYEVIDKADAEGDES